MKFCLRRISSGYLPTLIYTAKDKNQALMLIETQESSFVSVNIA
jgi:hypothetical protein